MPTSKIQSLMHISSAGVQDAYKKRLHISHSCLRNQGKRNADHALIANWLLRLTDTQRNSGLSLCSRYFRNQCKYCCWPFF